MAEVRRATREDALYLAPRLREADAQELEELGHEPLESLTAGIDLTPEPFAIIHDGNPVAVFGVVPMPQEGFGGIWLLGSDELLSIRTEFLRKCRLWIDKLQAPYRSLNCIASERNTVHLQWLEWCGFVQVFRHEKFGPYELPFIQFARDRHV